VVGNHVTLADFDLADALSQMPRSGVQFANFEHTIAWKKNLDKSVAVWRSTGVRLQQRMNAALNAN